MKKINYFFASMLGFIPGFFVFNTIGAGLNKYVKQSDSFSFIDLFLNKEVYLPLIMFVFLILISFFIKKKIFDGKY